GREPLAESVHATEGRCRGNTKAEGVGHELGQWPRQRCQCAQRAIGKELSLQRRAEQWVVLKQPMHVLQARIADIFESQARQPTQTSGLQIVREWGGDI